MGALFPSGMERMLASAASEFKSEGVKGVILGQGSNHPYHSSLSEAGYVVHTIPTVKSLRGFLSLYRVLSKERPDVVHIHTESAFFLTVLASRVAGRARIIRTIHSVFRPEGRAAVSRRVQALLADKFVSRFVAPSPDVAENEVAWHRQAEVIYNWVSSEYIELGMLAKQDSRNALLAVLVGNCATIKNHEMVLRHLVANNYEVAHHGDEAHASSNERQMLDDLSETGRLRHRGTGAPLESLRSCGVFVLPSLHEGMSVALAEAIASGSPCLVADSIGLSWAKGIRGVQHISLENESEWASALSESGYRPVGGFASIPDLSAARGASEYARLYRDVIRSSSISELHTNVKI